MQLESYDSNTTLIALLYCCRCEAVASLMQILTAEGRITAEWTLPTSPLSTPPVQDVMITCVPSVWVVVQANRRYMTRVYTFTSTLTRLFTIVYHTS